MAKRTDEIISEIVDLLKALTTDRYYGKIEIILKAGKIVHMDQIKSTKFE